MPSPTRRIARTIAPAALLIGLLAAGLSLLASSAQAAVPVPQFLESWPCTGCRGVTVAPNGDVYTVSRDHVNQFTESGALTTTWPLPVLGTSGSVDAYGINAAPNGHLFVTDCGGSHVTEWSSAGALLNDISAAATPEGQWNCPLGVTTDASGNLYVGDANGYILKFASNGAFLRVLATHGSAQGHFITVLGIAIGPTGIIYATDWQNDRVQALTPTGELLFEFAWPMNGDANPIAPHGCTIGPDGVVYVAVPSRPEIRMYTAQGDYLGQFGTQGSGPGEFRLPFGLAIDHQGRLLVADEFNNRIAVYGYPVVPARRSSWGALKSYYR